MTRAGTQLELNGAPYRFTGINIYNANNSSGCWYAMAGGSVLDDSIVELGGGAKVFRAWFFQALATSAGARDWSGFDHTLAVAAARSKRVIVTLGNQWGDCDGPGGGAGSYKDDAWYTTGYQQPDPAGTVSYRDFVAEIVARYKDDPTILAWQLMNEAEVKPSQNAPSCSTNAAQILKAFATDVSGLIKSIDSNHLVSLGTIGGGQCGAQGAEYQDVHDVATIDLCEYHDYGSPTVGIPGDQWNGLQVRLDQCNALNKPLFIGESGIKPPEIDGTLGGRAGAFDAKFNAQFSGGVVGELVWAWNANGSSVSDYDIGPGDPIIDVLQTWHESLGPNTPPDANADVGGPGPPFNVLANDRDPDGDPLTVVSYSGPPSVSFACTSSGECTWQPVGDWCVTPPPPGAFAPTYTVSDGRGGTDIGLVSVVYVYVCDPPPSGADMAITKTDSVDPVAAGAQLTYTLTVDNIGSADAAGVVVTDTLPVGTSFVSASDGGTESAGVVTWNLGSFGAADPPRELTVTVAVSVVQTADLVNEARVATSSADGSTTNDSDTETTAVSPSDSPSITVTPTVLPPGGGAVFVSGTGFTPGEPLSGLGEVFIKRCSTPPGFPLGLCDAVLRPSRESVNGDPLSVVDASGSFGPILVVVPPTFAGLGLGGADLPCNPCTLVVENPTATGLEAVSAPIAFNASSDNFPVCTDVSLQVSFGSPVDFAVNCSDVDNDVLTYTVVRSVGAPNLGTVSGVGPDYTYTPTANNALDTFVVTATDGRGGYGNAVVRVMIGNGGIVDLSVTKSDDVDPVAAGARLTYTLTVDNAGPADAAGVWVTDYLPSGVSFVSASDGGTESGGVVTWSLGQVAATDPPRELTVVVDVPVSQDADLENYAEVSTSSTEENTANNSALESTGLAPLQPLVVRGFKLNDLNNSNSVDPGEPRVADWPIRVYVNADGDQELDPEEIGSGIETLTDAAGNYSFSLQPGMYLICEERQAGWEQSPSDPPSVWGGPSVCQADPSVYPAGYTITVAGGQPTRQFGFANHQPVPPQPLVVRGFKLNDLNNSNSVDPGEPRVADWPVRVYVNADGDQELDADEVASAVETLTDASGSYSFSLQPGKYLICEGRRAGWEQSPSDPPSQWGGPSVCQADPSVYPAGYTITVAGGQPTRQFGFANHQPAPPAADLSITKVDSMDPVVAGSQLTYTLTVDNAGPADAADVVVTDTLPAGVAFVSASDGGTESGGVVTWNLGAVAEADPPKDLTLVVVVDAGEIADLQNTAEVTTTTTDSSAADNTAGETTAVTPPPQVVRGFKFNDLDRNNADTGEPRLENWTIKVYVNADGDQQLDADEVASAVETTTDGSGDYSFTLQPGKYLICEGRQAGWEQSPSDPPSVWGGPGVCQADPSVYPAGYTITVGGGEPTRQFDFGNFEPPPPAADLSITKVDSVDPVVAGSQLTYTLTVDNAGPGDAEDVVVTDTLPDGVSFVSASDGGTESGGVVTWNLGQVAPADPPKELTLVVEVAAGRTADIENTARVSTSTPDSNATNDTASETTAIDALTLTVNTTDDVDDGACTTAHCSLREAINRANSLPTHDVIGFDIAAPLVDGVHTIRPLSALPQLGNPEGGGVDTLDATTEPDFVSCSDGPVVEIDGSNAGADADGLRYGAPGVIRGLVINGFHGPGRAGLVLVSNTESQSIECNYIGTDATGTTARPNTYGVLIEPATGGALGGPSVDQRNLISGNDVGVYVQGSGATLLGNYIGTDVTGTFDLGNASVGVLVDGGSSVTIGGAAAGEGNLISGNGAGVRIEGSDNLVAGNLIGTDSTGTRPLGNATDGVLVGSAGAENNVVGEGNVIAFNGAAGVVVEGGNANAISANSIHSNGGLGIDLDSAGVTANDPGDGDVGANSLQNYPELTSAVADGGETTIAGSLDTTPGNYRIELFSSPTCDGSGNGEGTTFLGSENVTVGGAPASFTTTLPVEVTIGHAVTASATTTTTDPGGTSEFSECVNVTAPAQGADLSVAKSDSVDPVRAGSQLTYTLTVDNAGPGDAEDVVVTDTLPAGVAFVSASDGGTESGGVVTWNLGTVAAADPPKELTLVVEVARSQVAGLVNDAQISTSTTDLEPGNDTTSESTAVDSLPGTIRLRIVTDPPGQPQQFAFTGAIPGSAADGAPLEGVVIPGTYDVRAFAIPGWGFDAISCDDGDSTVNLAQSSASVVVDGDETVTCVFEASGRVTELRFTDAPISPPIGRFACDVSGGVEVELDFQPANPRLIGTTGHPWGYGTYTSSTGFMLPPLVPSDYDSTTGQVPTGSLSAGAIDPLTVTYDTSTVTAVLNGTPTSGGAVSCADWEDNDLTKFPAGPLLFHVPGVDGYYRSATLPFRYTGQIMPAVGLGVRETGTVNCQYSNAYYSGVGSMAVGGGVCWPGVAITRDALPGPPASGGEARGFTVASGGSVSTDFGEGDGATLQQPIEVALTSPTAGDVSVLVHPMSSSAPGRYSMFGWAASITAPAGSDSDPLILEFRLDPSLVPPTINLQYAQVFRNKQVVPDCPAGATSWPSACVAARTLLPGGDALITVRTPAASAWQFGVEASFPPGAPEVELAPGPGSLTVRWSAPEDDGGSPITHYLVEVAGSVHQMPEDARTTVFDGLVGGKEYTVIVQAVNEVGLGRPATVTATPNVVNLCAGPAPAGAIVRGAGNDRITGTAGDDVIFDAGGANTIDGRGGNDVICTGGGEDRIDGGAGDDVVFDAGGANRVDGGSGNDQITVGNGSDRVDGGSGNDYVQGGGGANVLSGGSGVDVILAGAGADRIEAGEGADTVIDAGGANTVDGGSGADVITTGAGDDRIDGGADADTIDAGAGANRVDGGGGRDTVRSGAGADRVDGGSDDDTVDAGDGNNDVRGGSGNDSLTTGAGDDRIDGGAGLDTCRPGGGANTVKNCEA